MSILHILHETYLKAEARGQVDNPEFDVNGRNLLILPIFHHNRRSKGNDILEIVLNQDGRADHLNFIPEDNFVIFPVTEESLNRTSGARAHPLCDDMQYLSQSLDPQKYENYCASNTVWSEAVIRELQAETDETAQDLINFLQEVQRLIRDHDLLTLSKELIKKAYNCEEGGQNKLKILTRPHSDQEKAQYKSLDLNKAFITFRKQFGNLPKPDLNINTNQLLHTAHIKYIKSCQAQEPETFDYCDLSGEEMFCTDTCRGLLGTSKIISVSNHTETYKGRFRNKQEVYRIGSETSERIFLMLKFFLEHKENSQYLSDNATAVLWFEKDLLNVRGFDISQPVEMSDGWFSFGQNGYEDEEEIYQPHSLSNPLASHWKQLLVGQESLSPADEDDFFYLLIINKVSNGRMAIQATRTLPLARFIDNLRKWRDTCTWPRWDRYRQEFTNKTPSTWDIVNLAYGREEEGTITLRNDKLKSLAFRRLLPSILDGRPLPPDMARKMFTNFTKRALYPKTWAKVVYMTCALESKRRRDQGKEVTINMLEQDQQTRDYLYGRLLAIYEKIELDAMSNKSTKDGDKQKDKQEGKQAKGKEDSDKDPGKRRVTNVEKLWSAFFQAPEKSLAILSRKIQPYLQRLKNQNPGFYVKHQKLLGEITMRIREAEDYHSRYNSPLKEDAVFGYYAQNQDFYTPKSKEEEK